MTGRRSLGIIQMNDSHAYMDIHQEMFWQGDRAVYRPAEATLVNQIRAESQDRVLFCDCGDTLHGTYPALKTQGESFDSCLEFTGY